MTQRPTAIYQVIYSQRNDSNVHQMLVTGDNERGAKAAFYLQLNRYGRLRGDIQILSLLVADTPAADQAIVAAQALQDAVDAKVARA